MRLEVFNHYGAQCKCCGEQELRFLAIDHIYGQGSQERKKHNRSGHTMYVYIKKNNFPARFQVLCHNCNMAKAFYGQCPHQEQH